jgi:quinoprotein relay system zinc metallohydrolase 2
MTLLSRRDAIIGAALAAAWTTGVRAAGSTSPVFVPVADGVFVSPGRHELFTPENRGHVSNVTLIIGRDGAAVIDTGGSAGLGRSLRTAITSLTDRPVRYVISTHMHPDHVFGHAPFRGDQTVFAGHAKLPRALATRADRYLAANRDSLGPEAFEGTAIIHPMVLVTDQLRLDLGDRPLVLKAHKTAHTDNDLTVLDQRTGTLILGDLLFSGHIPTIDGSIKGWLALLSELRSTQASRAIPGHGPPVMDWPAALNDEQRYLTAIATEVRALIKSGKTLTDAVGTVGRTEKDAWLLFDDFHARNVSAAFAELEWE